MLKQTVTYTDFNDNTQVEDLYFNLSKTEIVDLELDPKGSLSSRLEAVSKTQDASEVYRQIKDIILKAYGRKSEDGRKFQKSEAIRIDFEESAVYDEFVWGMFKEPEKLTAFLEGIVPKQAIEEALEEQEARKKVLENPDVSKHFNKTEDESDKGVAPGPSTGRENFYGEEIKPEKPAESSLTPEQVAEFLRDNPDALTNYGK